MSTPAMSRRGLFGAGLRRAATVRLDELEPAGGGREARSWGDDRSSQLGAHLEPVAEAMVELAELGPGEFVMAAAAGNNTLALAAARADATAISCPYVPFPWEDASFDAVLGFFSVTSHPDLRFVARELKRVARAGAPIVLAAWSGQPWARYETAYRHFFGFPDLDVTEHELPESGMAYSLVFARKP